ERQLLTHRIEATKKQRAVVATKVGDGDTVFVKRLRAYDAKLAELRAELDAFDKRQEALTAAAGSKETASAAKAARKAAEEFETKLRAAAVAARKLTDAAQALADARGVRDPGIWPHRHPVDAAVRARILDRMGRIGGTRLPGFGSVGR